MGEQEPSLVPATFGRFVAGAELGRGATGVVIRARDPELDRDVAIKVLHDGGGEELRREAQAMARLSHPNVVAVYESGQAGDRRFIAMELVEGTTLAAWLAAAPRTWREVVAAFVAAGRGLAAAHAAGVVHRDFKPDNVLVGHDGRPRVTDFGVSISGIAPDAVVDARTDQHAFCAALAKALTRTPGAPASIRAALARGLQAEPSARWPAMDELLAALDVPPVRRRWPWIAAVGAAAVALIGVALVVVRWAPAAGEACPDPARRLVGVWDPTVKARLRLAFAIASPFRADEATARVERVVEPYARRWRVAHREVCRATRVTHVQPPAELDRRMACLDQRRDALGNLTTLLARADRELVGRAGEAAGALPDVDGCLDPRVMQAPALPVDPEVRRQLALLDARLGALTASDYQAKPADQLAATTAALAEARRLGYVPALVRALRLHQRALNATAAGGAEIAAIVEELAQRAAETHDDTVSAWAWIDLFSLRSGDTADPAAEALLPVAEDAVNRAGATPVLRYRLASARAVHLARGKHIDAALELFHTAHGLADTDERRADIQLNITKLTFMTRGGAAALPEATKLVPACQAGYGANSPSTAACHQLLAQVLMASGDDDQAEPHLREALRIRSSVLAPDHPDVAASLHTLGNFAAGRGDLDTARRVLQRALDIYDRRGDRAAAGRVRGLLGSYVAWIDYPRARQLILRGFDDLAATKGPDSREHLEAELNFALLLASDKYCAESLSYLIAAAPRLEKVQPRGLPLLLWTWADCEAVAFGNERGALVRLERAYALCETGACDPPMFETVMFRMGRIHFEVLGHQDRGRKLVDEAATLAREHDAKNLVAEIGRWQLAHPPTRRR